MVARISEKQPSNAESPKVTLDRLLKRLVAQASGPHHHTTTAAAAPPPPEDGVLLDKEIDGVRCVLVRAPEPPAGTGHARVGPTLSPREQEIARMVASGYPNKIIADVLEISCWTVGTHLRRMFAKLGVTSRAAMVARILEANLLKPIPGTAGHPLPGTRR